MTAVSTVFWPSPCPGSELERGFIVGWVNGDAIFVVACIIPCGEPESAFERVRAVQSDPKFQDFHRYCAGIPCIMGEWCRELRNCNGLSGSSCWQPDAAEWHCRHKLLIAALSKVQVPHRAVEGSGMPIPWMDEVVESDIRSHSNQPALFATSGAPSTPDVINSSLPSLAFVEQTDSATSTAALLQHAASIVTYNPPACLSLDIFASNSCRRPAIHALGATAVVRVQHEPPKQVFDYVLNQCNSSSFLSRLVGPVRTRAHPSSVVGHVCSWALQPLVLFLLFARAAAVLIISCLQWRFPAIVPMVGGLAFYEISTLARQCHLKLWEFATWPRTLFRLRSLRRGLATGVAWHSPDALFTETAAWNDSLWRAVIDVIVGVCVCLLFAYTPWAVKLVLNSIHTFGQILHIDVLRAWVDWLMGVPAGLKLNHFASKKIGGAVLSCIDFWEYFTTYLTPFEPAIVVIVGAFGLGGFSLLMALASDILDLATLHLFGLYTQFAWLHHKQMNLLGSLWKLFRGKKFNVLRKRVDSNDYDIGQLLLGTLFFTVVFFIFPTTLVYYAFFLMVWMFILIIRSVIWWLITLMNNLPVYHIYCMMFAKNHLPMGVYLCSQAVSVPTTLDEVDIDSSTAIMARSRFGHSSNICDEPVRRVPPWQQVQWFGLKSINAAAGVVLTPFVDALGVVSKRYTLGALLRSILFGQQGLGLFRSVGVAQSKAPSAGSSGVAASGLAFAGHNAAANAPTEGPVVPVARSSDQHVITERMLSQDAALGVGSWRQFHGELQFIVEDVCLV